MPYTIMEKALTSKERNNLDDSQFGIPEERKYPLNDEAHVRAAVKFFNKVEPKYEESLARRIIKRIKELDLDIEVGEDNKLSKYYKSPKKESTILVVEAAKNPIKINKVLREETEVPNYSPNEIKLYKQYAQKMFSDIGKVFTSTLNKYSELKNTGIYTLKPNSWDQIKSNYWKSITDNEIIYYTFFDSSDEDFGLTFARYDIWDHKDIKVNKLNARNADEDRESVWDNKAFVDQMDQFIDNVCEEINKLEYGKASYDSDWDTGSFDITHTANSKKLNEFMKKNNL